MISQVVKNMEGWSKGLTEVDKEGVYKHNWATRNLFARTFNVILIPLGVIARILDAAIGVLILLPLNTLTFGKIGPLNDLTKDCLNQLSSLFSKAYMTALRVINPSAKQDKVSISRCIDEAFIDGARLRDNNFFNRHITLRLTSLVYAVAYLVARVADAAIGLVMIPLSLATWGVNETINSFASRALAFPMIIGDLYACFMRAVMPNVDIRTCAL